MDRKAYSALKDKEAFDRSSNKFSDGFLFGIQK